MLLQNLKENWNKHTEKCIEKVKRLLYFSTWLVNM